MKKNIHSSERILRIAGGLLLASLSLWGPKKKILITFLIPALTGVVGICPVYSALGISTRPKKEKAIDAEVAAQANEYFPIQSPSEIAAGHPLVGSS